MAQDRTEGPLSSSPVIKWQWNSFTGHGVSIQSKLGPFLLRRDHPAAASNLWAEAYSHGIISKVSAEMHLPAGCAQFWGVCVYGVISLRTLSTSGPSLCTASSTRPQQECLDWWIHMSTRQVPFSNTQLLRKWVGFGFTPKARVLTLYHLVTS